MADLDLEELERVASGRLNLHLRDYRRVDAAAYDAMFGRSVFGAAPTVLSLIQALKEAKEALEPFAEAYKAVREADPQFQHSGMSGRVSIQDFAWAFGAYTKLGGQESSR